MTILRRRFWVITGFALLVSLCIFLLSLIPTAELAEFTEPDRQLIPAPWSEGSLVCTGIVESSRGEIDIRAQITGEVAKVLVSEGQSVKKGDLLAVVDSPIARAEREIARAELGLAKARLRRLLAGTGEEEKQEALFAASAAEADLAFEKVHLARLKRLLAGDAATLDAVQRSENRLKALTQKVASLRKRYEALERGPLPEDIKVAEAEVEVATAELQRADARCDYGQIRAPVDGKVSLLHVHAGDSVTIDEATPVVRLVAAGPLRIKIEIDELDAVNLRLPIDGTFRVRGASDAVGKVRAIRELPRFGPKRLFEPDRSAREDTRTMFVLCEIESCDVPLYPGQRVTAVFPRVPRQGEPKTASQVTAEP